MEGVGGEGQATPNMDSVWKERCHELEGSLCRFKEQTAKIRESLGEKVPNLMISLVVMLV